MLLKNVYMVIEADDSPAIEEKIQKFKEGMFNLLIKKEDLIYFIFESEQSFREWNKIFGGYP